MKRLSTPTELQQAIDGNKREGRRSGYDTYSMFPGPRPQVPLPPSSLPLPQISPLPPGLRPPSSFNGGFPGSLSKFHSIKKKNLLGLEMMEFATICFILTLVDPSMLQALRPSNGGYPGSQSEYFTNRRISLIDSL